jgi:hypothetical protein
VCVFAGIVGIALPTSERMHAPDASGRSKSRARRNYGSQAISTPFVRLNVALVQKFAALRYQAWYVRVLGPVICPRTLTGGSPGAG